MGWTIWLYLAVCLGGIYALALILYRLYLSIRALMASITKTQALLADLMDYEPLDFTPAQPSSNQDLADVLMARRAFKKTREAQAEARQRRLVKRISHIEIDKR